MTSYLMNHFYRDMTDLFFSNDTLGICPNEDINTKVEHETLANAVIMERNRTTEWRIKASQAQESKSRRSSYVLEFIL